MRKKTVLVVMTMTLLLTGCKEGVSPTVNDITSKESAAPILNEMGDLDIIDEVRSLITPYLSEYPEGIEVKEAYKGDIGKDGQVELVAVLEYFVPRGPESERGEHYSRILCLFTPQGEKYALAYRNDWILPNSDSGGVLGDPFVGIEIKDGVLVLSRYGGSSSRWGYDYLFEMSKEELVLTKVVEINHSTHTGNGIDKIRQRYYPDMKKIDLPCEQEIRDNYSTLLGYEVPSYYYKSEEGTLEYESIDFHFGYERWEHRVEFVPNSENDIDSLSYYIWDDTGEVEK